MTKLPMRILRPDFPNLYPERSLPCTIFIQNDDDGFRLNSSRIDGEIFNVLDEVEQIGV